MFRIRLFEAPEERWSEMRKNQVAMSTEACASVFERCKEALSMSDQSHGKGAMFWGHFLQWLGVSHEGDPPVPMRS